jgi:hypothetical protein
MTTPSTMSTFSGAWLRNAFVQPDRTLHTADPAHSVTDTTPAESWTYDAPPFQESQYGNMYVGEEWVVQTEGGPVIPDQTAEDGAPSAVQDSDADYLAQNMPSHADGGATTLVQNSGHAAPMAFWDERTLVPRVQTNVNTEITPVALQRGLNGLAENNPDGYREGYDTQVWVDRHLAIGERVHDHRVVTVNTATAPVNAPAVGNPYGNPFASLARAIVNVRQVPELRRDPVTPDDAILASQTPTQQTAPAYADWVVG